MLLYTVNCCTHHQSDQQLFLFKWRLTFHDGVRDTEPLPLPMRPQPNAVLLLSCHTYSKGVRQLRGDYLFHFHRDGRLCPICDSLSKERAVIYQNVTTPYLMSSCGRRLSRSVNSCNRLIRNSSFFLPQPCSQFIPHVNPCHSIPHHHHAIPMSLHSHLCLQNFILTLLLSTFFTICSSSLHFLLFSFSCHVLNIHSHVPWRS